MPVPKLYPESVAAKFRPGTLQRIKLALVEGETRMEFIRRMVEVGLAISDMEGFGDASIGQECRAEFVHRMVEEGLARAQGQASEIRNAGEAGHIAGG